MGVGSVLDASHNLLEDDFGGTASLGVGMSASYYGGRRPHSHRLSSKVLLLLICLVMCIFSAKWHKYSHCIAPPSVTSVTGESLR